MLLQLGRTSCQALKTSAGRKSIVAATTEQSLAQRVAAKSGEQSHTALVYNRDGCTSCNSTSGKYGEQRSQTGSLASPGLQLQRSLATDIVMTYGNGKGRAVDKPPVKQKDVKRLDI